jgi:hypothetical protein
MIVVLTIEQGALAGACRSLRIGAWRIVLAPHQGQRKHDARKKQEIWNFHGPRIDRRRVSAIYGEQIRLRAGYAVVINGR